LRLRSYFSEYVKEQKGDWKAEGLMGRLLMLTLLIAVLLSPALFIKYANAELLGPDVKVTHLYAGPAVTAIDSRTELGAIVGIRHNWHPADLVGEIVLREKSSVNLMLAKRWGDTRVLGGIGFQDGGKNTALVIGADYKRFMVRVSAFDTSTTSIVPGAPIAVKRDCDKPPAPIVSTGSKGHSAITVGWVYKL